MPKTLKRILLSVACLLLVLVLAVGGYVLYVVLQYHRVPDHTALDINGNSAVRLQAGTAYTAITYNIGFGAYNHDFTAFTDTGTMADGTPTKGQFSKARSRDIVEANTSGSLATAAAEMPDLVLMQEVDTDSTRSYRINQVTSAQAQWPQYGAVYAQNFDSAFLAYPLNDMTGTIHSGLLTLSRFEVEAAERRTYPVDLSFPTKFFDLDRCFSVTRLPVEGGGELVLINNHMSAFDEGGLIRAQQMEMLMGVLAEEQAKGNWVIVGGDFNHALHGTLESYPSGQQVPPWIYPFDDNVLPAGFSAVRPGNVGSVASCRSVDIPYQPGVNYTVTVDGFIVSSNVSATSSIVNTNFATSDHNPVTLRFTLER